MPKVITSIKILVLDLKPHEVTIKALTLHFTQFFLLTHLCDILAVRAQPCLLFRGGSAWAPSLPDHRWLDSDQQYHFVKVHALCKYPYEKFIIDCSFSKPNVAPQCQFIGQF